MTKIFAIRKHEIHTGHRVYGHPGKCKSLHGHSYIIHFYCEGNKLNELGMVVDFGIIKETLCKWLDDNYDHKMLIWEGDPIHIPLRKIEQGIVVVPFNPTAENIAYFLLNTIAPDLLKDTGINVTKVTVEETSKCRAECINE